jgi:putative transposase
VKESKMISLEERAQDEAKSYLEELLSEGARKLLQTAIENEVVEYLEAHRERRTETGQRAIVRNGHHPERELVTGVGPIKVRQPRIRHRDDQKFSSAILPPYMRRVPSILSAKAYVYWWADGIYFNVRLDEERSCVLVLMGALEDGTQRAAGRR